MHELSNVELYQILEIFYCEVKKKNTTEEGEFVSNYKNSSLRAFRAALTRHFKAEHDIDLIRIETFIKNNMTFLAITKSNKEEGLGNVTTYPPINDTDMDKLTAYFKQKMYGNPDPQALQQIVQFLIIYYLCRFGCENLRKMSINMFGLATDPQNGMQYIYQCVDEADKNHSHGDTSTAIKEGSIKFQVLKFVKSYHKTPDKKSFL